MAKILINKEIVVNGKLSISRDMTSIVGELSTHQYFEEIEEIESDRYRLTDIEVLREDFGSNDFDILYTFKASDIEIKGGCTNLTKDVIDIIEREMYDSDDLGIIRRGVKEEWKIGTN